MLSLPPSQHFFNHVKMFLGLKQYLAEDKESCSRSVISSVYASPQIRVLNWKWFFLLSTKTYAVGIKQNRLEHPKHMFKLMDNKTIAIFGDIFA